MIWTTILLFLTIVTGVIGFLGLGFGPIEPAKMAFYVFSVILFFSFFIKRGKNRKRYYK